MFENKICLTKYCEAVNMLAKVRKTYNKSKAYNTKNTIN